MSQPPWASAPATTPALTGEVVWSDVPAPTTAEPKFDVEAFALQRELGSLIALGMATDARSLQRSIGSSQIGKSCDKQLAYMLRGTPPTNAGATRGRLRRLIGTGTHLALAEVFRRLDHGSGTFLVEQPVSYRGVPGTADLVLRAGSTVIDWKTAKRAKIARIRREGVPRHYQVQVQMYAAALVEAGEDIRRVAVVYIPIDNENNEDLEQVYVWTHPVDRRIADDAVERLERIAHERIEDVKAKPDRLCAYCDHYQPGSTNLAVGCPGPEGVTK